jgi:ribonuclease PH
VNRISGRKYNELRKINITKNVNRYAAGSCIVSYGNTQVLCIATIDDTVPPFIRNTGKGWLSAEYGMIPGSTHTRLKGRDKHISSGRTHEIQRLIGRSLRACIDLKLLGERQIFIDCDVLQADGGTRTASITGGYAALSLAISSLLKDGVIRKNPLITNIAAVSCGILKGKAILDLNYEEDSEAEVDANFVMNDKMEIIEVQASGEESRYTKSQLIEMLDLAEGGIQEIIEIQRKILES